VPPILVDAGPLVALLDRGDSLHARAVQRARELRAPRLTVWPAVTEAMYLLGRFWTAQQALWTMLESGALGLAPLDSRDAPRMRELMEKYRDRPMDLADAALVRVAERDRLRRIWTVDRDGFAAYRIDGRKRFDVLD
jgi:predicted nucleic acid-binding protein